MTVSMHKYEAVLDLPGDSAGLYIRGKAIVDSVDGNPWFPTPVPPVAEMRAALVALHEATAAAATRTAEAVSRRREAHREVVSLLRFLRAYVERIADKNMESAPVIITSAGMRVREVHRRAIRPFTVEQGRVSGEAVLRVRVRDRRSTYQWQMSLDRGLTWIDLPPTTRSYTTVAGLTPNVEVWFRYRTVTRTGEGDWSDPVTFNPR